MAMAEDAQLMLRVRDVTGLTQDHIYPIAAGENVVELFKEVMEPVAKMLFAEGSGFFSLENPLVVYAKEHVVSIEIEWVGLADIEEAQEELRKMSTGFLRAR